MKHMKRALSLVLAMVMLLGMMAIPTGAVSNFTDEAEITYKEAVEVTSGLGLFAGSDGKFMPKGTVTRAQMATIIIKMLHGSDANADSFKGVSGGFTDTASFEGGWAEGYINWCASLGVVAGYGDGTFRPGQAVTTAEAVTMILNALKIDAGPGSWPFTVMSKAEELKFFKDLSPKPDTDQPLTREELAVIAFHGLEYSPEDKMGYVYNGVVYDDYMAAYLAANRDASKVDPAKKDSLAADVFGLKNVIGFVTRNQATGLDYTEVQVAINGAMNTYKFAIETDQTAIGHYVTVYYDEQYKNEKEPGTTYTIFDETTVVEVTEDIDSRADFRDAFGSASVKLSTVEACVINADYTVKAGYPKAAGGFAANDVTFVTGNIYDVPAGTYILDGNTVMSYIAPAAVYASVVDGVETYEGEDTVILRGVVDPIPNSEGDDMIDEYVAMKAGDYVTYTKVGERYILERVRVVTGKVSSQSKTEINGNEYPVVTVDGVDYVAFSGTNASGLNANVAQLNYTDTYDFYTTRDGKFIGFKTSDGSFNVDDVAYILGTVTTTKKDSYGDQIIWVYARGVDMNGVEALIPVAQVEDADRDGVVDNTETALGDPNTTLAEGFYRVKDHTDKDARKEGLRLLTPFSDTYNKDTDPVFEAVYLDAQHQQMKSVIFGGMGTFNSGTAKSFYGVKQNTSKYLILEGTATQSTPLEAHKHSGTFDMSKVSVAKALISRTEEGGYVVETMIFRTGNASAMLGGQVIYVSQDKNTPSGTSAAGHTYDVYSAANGTEMQLILKNGGTLTPGFYQVAFDEEAQQHEFIGNNNGYIPATTDNTTILGQTDTTAALADGVANGSGCYDLAFQYATGTNLFIGKAMNMNASGVAVVDTRTQAQKDGSRVGTITSLDRIASLKSSNEDLYIVMNFWFNSSTDKVTAIYITDVQKVEEITDITGVETVLTEGYTLSQIEDLLNAKESKIMGVTTTTHDGKTGLFVNSAERSLRQVTLNAGDIIAIAAPFADDAGYVEATIVSTTNPEAYAGWDCMVKFDTATATTVGNYRVSVDNGAIKLTLGVTESVDDLNTLGAQDTVNFGGDVYAGYANETWLRENIADNLLVVKADNLAFGDVAIVNVTSAYYTVPEDVLLYSVAKSMAKGASSGEFIVVDAKNSGLTVGETYYFEYNGTDFFNTDTTVYCYAYEAGKLLSSGAMGVRKDTNNYWTGSEFGAVSGALYNGRFGYHRTVTGVTVSGTTYTMAQDAYHGEAGNTSGTSHHSLLGNCINVSNVHSWMTKNWTTGVETETYPDVKNKLDITNATIVDARNVADNAKISSAAELKAAVDAGAVVVDYIAAGKNSATNGTTINYIVVVDTTKISK